jgi:hypothetical protein
VSIVITQVTENGIRIGADTSQTGNDGCQTVVEGNKIFRVGDIVVGIVGQMESANALRFVLEDYVAMEPLVKEPTWRTMLDFYYSYSQAAQELGIHIRGSDEEGVTGPIDAFHMVIENTAWCFRGFHVEKINDTSVIGCGSPYALGALYSGATLEHALYASCKYDIHCSRPVIVYDINREGQIQQNVLQ